MPELTPTTLGSLHFLHSGNWTADCTLLLRDDRTIQLVPSPLLQQELDGLLGAVSLSSLKWGTSLVAILATVGAAFYLRNRRGAAAAAFVGSGLSAAVGFGVRRYSTSILPWLLSPISVDAVTVQWLDDDSLKIIINDGRLKRFTATLEPHEYDAEEAIGFTKAFAAVRG